MTLPKINIHYKLKERKFWMAIVAALLPVLNSHFEWGLDAGEITKMIGALVSFIVAEGYSDGKRAGNPKK